MRHALIAASVACLGLGGWAWWATGQRDAAMATAAALQAELDVAQHRIEQAMQAAAVHRAYVDRLQGQLAQAAQDEEDAFRMEGADAPLPDYLRSVLDRLR
jgi:predicted negative regulator of RcsB-dependent stress response